VRTDDLFGHRCHDRFEERQEETPEGNAVHLVDESPHLVDASDDESVVPRLVRLDKVVENERARKGVEEWAEIDVRLGRAGVGRDVERRVERSEAARGMEGSAAGEVAEESRRLGAGEPGDGGVEETSLRDGGRRR
jgi:hypothetical protein